MKKHCFISLVLLYWIGWLSCQAGLNTVYFLVTPQESFKTAYHASFVLPLEQPEQIAYARRIIAEPNNPDLQKGVLAKVAIGKDGINRNYAVAGAPEWSWHITQFINFIDVALPEEDIDPTGLELIINRVRSVPSWRERYSFLTFRVTAELGPVLYLVLQKQDFQWVFKWSQPLNSRTDFRWGFTLESATTLNPPDWQPLPGVSWPILDVNQWILTNAVIAPRFYRIKALELK